ncbi:MAG: O-antigen ligase family protein [Xanthobacteraceae bacterium]|nr:O-antigen ligase family protein [Xanthobacteraceae bacterium]
MTVASLSVGDFRRDALPRVVDILAVLVAASLPWSTSATGILIALWLVATVPTLSIEGLRREVISAPGGLPVLLALFAALAMAWAGVPFAERLHGLDSFLRLLTIPMLLAQFRRSDRGWLVGAAFLCSATVLLATSYVMINLPNALTLGRGYGVPVKDDIAQSGIFTLCAFALFRIAVDRWNEGRRGVAAAGVALGLLFLANMIYVVTSRTALVVIPLLYVLLAFHLRLNRRSLRAIVAYAAAGLAPLAFVWMTSHHLRARVSVVSSEINEHVATGADTSSGARLEFWKYSLRIVEDAPLVGHGTGTIGSEFQRHADGAAGASARNPHNQIFTVAIQLGAIGVLILLAMWSAHWLMFTGPGLTAWIGMVVVTQNIVGCLFNSHLLDFTQGWLYVFGVGVLGGTVLRHAKVAAQPAVSAPRP